MKKITYTYQNQTITRQYEIDSKGRLVVDGFILSKELKQLKNAIKKKNKK